MTSILNPPSSSEIPPAQVPTQNPDGSWPIFPILLLGQTLPPNCPGPIYEGRIEPNLGPNGWRGPSVYRLQDIAARAAQAEAKARRDDNPPPTIYGPIVRRDGRSPSALARGPGPHFAQGDFVYDSRTSGSYTISHPMRPERGGRVTAR